MKKKIYRFELLFVSAVLLAGVLTTSCKKKFSVIDDSTSQGENGAPLTLFTLPLKFTANNVPVEDGTFMMGATEEQGTDARKVQAFNINII